MSKVRSRLRVEEMEGREVPAAIGFPWGNAGHLTLSFAPDGTTVGAHQSSLSTTFANVPDYKAQILRAFQTWAVPANVSIALVADDGSPFGTNGPTQGDERFGDIRIAATPMTSESVAVSAPHEVFQAGTWAGDVVFNADKLFGPGGIDVFKVALHEAGHVLGLDHSTSRLSAMYSHLGTGRTSLSAGDVYNLRTLYGARAADPFETGPGGNNAPATATRMDLLPDADFDGDVPLAVYGDLKGTADVDYFAVVIPRLYEGAVTFRLQTAGVSLLNPALTVLDGAGRPLGPGKVTSTNLGGDAIEITVHGVTGNKFYARVDGANNDPFGIGTYALAVTLDEELDPQVTDERIDAVLRGPYRSLGQEDLQYLFEDPAYLLNMDDGTNETVATATRLVLPRGYRSPTHFEFLGSIDFPIAGVPDVDTYAVRTPAWARPGALTANVRIQDVTATPPTIQVTDQLGNTVAAEILANGNGVYTVHVTKAAARRDYFLSVRGAPGTNYTLTVDLTKAPAPVETFATSAPAAGPSVEGRALYVAESQVFAWTLAAAGPAGSVRMTVINKAGATVYSLTAPAGATMSGPAVFLERAGYAVVFEFLGGATGYTLRGGGLTIPIGPTPTDPTIKPDFTSPTAPPGTYVYPADLYGYDPYLADLIQRTYGLPTRSPGDAQTMISPDPYEMMPLVP